MNDPDAQMKREYRRQQIVEEAVRVADEIILNTSDGSESETNCLTARFAYDMFEQAVEPLGVSTSASQLKTLEARRAVSEVINKGVIGTEEDTPVVRNYLRMRVASEFVNKVEIIFNSIILMWEFSHPALSDE